MKEIERLIKIRHDVIIASIIQYSSGGVVCIAMEGELMDKLKLPPMLIFYFGISQCIWAKEWQSDSRR